MYRFAAPIRSCCALLLALPLCAAGGEVSKAEFFAQRDDYLPAFQTASAELHALIPAQKFAVVAVAEFTDMTGGKLHIGQTYAEELSTLLVEASIAPQPKKGAKKYKVMEPSSIEEFVRAGGGGSIWSSTKKIREFAKGSDVELVITGKIDISNREARFFLKAVETTEATIVWARTISVKGVAAGTETIATAAVAPPALEAQPLATNAPPVEPAVPESAAPATDAPADTVAAAAAITAISSNSTPAPSPPARPAPAVPLAAAVGLPPEVASFENGWLRARIRSASKYEGSGWVTAVLDVTNLSSRPMFIDVAQDDPGRGVDEFSNNWRVERVSGLRLAPIANPGMTPLGAQSTISVVVVLATTANPSGKRLTFGPNLLWFGSASAGDNGRVELAFTNVRVD